MEFHRRQGHLREYPLSPDGGIRIACIPHPGRYADIPDLCPPDEPDPIPRLDGGGEGPAQAGFVRYGPTGRLREREMRRNGSGD